MGMNFWQSTHYMYWMKSISENDLQKHNLLDRKHLTEEEINSIHLANISLMEEMGLILRIRQIVIYTAVIFYRRFYFSQSFNNFDPHLIAGTTLFLASKVEESQISLRNVVFVLYQCTTGGVDEDEALYEFQEKDMLECEFYVLQALQYDLILHHPFQPLLQFLDEYDLHDECLELSWQLVQYSFRTKIILLHPPFMVAYAAAYIACLKVDYDADQIFSNFNIRMDRILFIVNKFKDAIEEDKHLHSIQPAALEKLEMILPVVTSESLTSSTKDERPTGS
uniref:CyclinC putative n=1 Tax=Albugo laibachii Nc14 TaxID=890382 RepID=F0WG37_9STRA|nr:cyclinC putative [Albugo laibachii Nc14]|eukprot:CCA20171.1 cyclinC putative [Albugo laibachii Nc14]